MKAYSASSTDLADCIERMQSEHHLDLHGVTVAALFVYDDEADNDTTVLKHQGYPAAAVVRLTPTRDRALGVSDAVIVVDRSCWQLLSVEQKDALIDHELTHLTRVIDEESGSPVCDAVDRPKLRMRMHDRQLGWFDEIAQRHGEASPELSQAKQLIAQTQQLYFDFSSKRPRAGRAEPRPN